MAFLKNKIGKRNPYSLRKTYSKLKNRILRNRILAFEKQCDGLPKNL
jgi:hypothetical protein